MELRRLFNQDEVNYDNWRPRYVPELFQDILAFSRLDGTGHALEIGIGTGQATEPLLQTGCRLTAIDIGERMTDFVRHKFSHYEKFQAMNIDFESFQADPHSLDLIYSATAFHWIAEEIAYPKVRDLLKPQGTLALFWNHAIVPYEGEDVYVAIRQAYQKYRPMDHSPALFGESDCQRMVETLNRHGFCDPTVKLYHHTRTLRAKEYIALLNTYSDHRAMAAPARLGLEQEIHDAILAAGDALHIYNTIDLYLAHAQ